MGILKKEINIKLTGIKIAKMISLYSQYYLTFLQFQRVTTCRSFLVTLYYFIFIYFQLSLETKSGPVQAMKIEDITKFYHNDLVAVDSCGMMTVFCNRQILCRQSITDSCLNCLQIQKDKSKSSTRK